MRLAVHLTPHKGLPKNGLGDMLKEIAASGYHNVEITGIVDESVEAFRQRLDDSGLNVVAYEVELHHLTARPEAIAEEAKALGAEWVVITPVVLDEYGDGWALTGARLNRLAEKLREAGLRVAYRNGIMDFGHDGDKRGLEQLMTGAGPTLEAALDLDAANRTAEGPAEWLRRLDGRVPFVKVVYKRNGKKGTVADNHLDWPEILETAEQTGVEWALVDLEDKTEHLVDDARASHEFFSSLGIRD